MISQLCVLFYQVYVCCRYELLSHSDDQFTVHVTHFDIRIFLWGQGGAVAHPGVPENCVSGLVKCISRGKDPLLMDRSSV